MYLGGVEYQGVLTTSEAKLSMYPPRRPVKKEKRYI
jgi:hypothetical protein